MPMSAAIGAAGSVVSSVIGGVLGRRSAASAQRKNYQQSLMFAKNSIRWRKEDAERAGIHPLYALGAPSMSPNPVSPDYSASEAAAGVGNAVSGYFDKKAQAAIQAQQLAQQDKLTSAQVAELRSRALRNAMEAKRVENDIVLSQVSASAGSRVHNTVRGIGQPRSLTVLGHKIHKNPNMSDAQDVEDRYGDVASWIYGLGNIAADTYQEFKTHRSSSKTYRKSTGKKYVPGTPRNKY